LPFINDVSFRYSPKVSVSGFDASMWGVGIKHNIKQWIPVVKDLPFDAAVQAGYTKFSMNYDFPSNALITPRDLVTSPVTFDDGSTNASIYANQKMVINANSLTANLIVSKKLLFITPYLGFGVTKSSFDLTLAGTYPTLGNPKTHVVAGVTIPELNSAGYPIMLINHETDPVKISSSEVMPNMTIGLRLKFLMILSFHAQYIIQKYPMATAGLGISIR